MGYRRIYGFPGDGINGFFGVLQRANENRLHPGAARGDGRLRGLGPRQIRLENFGTSTASSGPGAAHLVTGLFGSGAGGACGANPGRVSGCDRQPRPAGCRVRVIADPLRPRLRRLSGPGLRARLVGRNPHSSGTRIAIAQSCRRAPSHSAGPGRGWRARSPAPPPLGTRAERSARYGARSRSRRSAARRSRSTTIAVKVASGWPRIGAAQAVWRQCRCHFRLSTPAAIASHTRSTAIERTATPIAQPT